QCCDPKSCSPASCSPVSCSILVLQPYFCAYFHHAAVLFGRHSEQEASSSCGHASQSFLHCGLVEKVVEIQGPGNESFNSANNSRATQGKARPGHNISETSADMTEQVRQCVHYIRQRATLN